MNNPKPIKLKYGVNLLLRNTTSPSRSVFISMYGLILISINDDRQLRNSLSTHAKAVIGLSRFFPLLSHSNYYTTY